MRLHREPLIVDSFAGGGGASLGIELALGRSPDIAINHDEDAIAMHAENHPATRHYRESVWNVDPIEATGGRSVDLAWFSPDCKHFSKAKGGKPVDRKVRGLAWVAVRWARAVRPRVIILENVEEFQTWGPLLEDGTPCPARRGLTFRRFVGTLERLGYAVEHRQLRACDYGAPTTRRRLFLIARCDGVPIAWPEPTHGPGLMPHMSAASVLDWSLPVPSIFDRPRPLAEPTLRRIARGMAEYVYGSRRPFFLVHQSNGERPGQAPRIYSPDRPLGTVVAQGIKQAVVAAFLAKHYGGHEGRGASLTLPMSTVTTIDHHALVAAALARGGAGPRSPQVRAFLTRYNATGTGAALHDPAPTITTRDRFGLVTVDGVDHTVEDIGMRMLAPRELFRAQGFPEHYRIGHLTKTAQVRMAGNSVCPPLAAAIVRANMVEPAALARTA